MYCKGADDIMIPRIVNNRSKVFENLNWFATKGRRTLVYAFKELDPLLTKIWIQKYDSCVRHQKFDQIASL